jgi:hypothetical protein
MAAAIGFGVANAAGAGGPAVPTPTAQRLSMPLAGPGTSQRPPTTPESTFVAVTNCRLVNTAKAGGKIKAGKSRSFLVAGTTGFAAQGGAAVGCGIPASATAISARLTASGVKKAGHFSAYPTGAPSTLGVLYYSKGQTATTGATEALAAGSGPALTVANAAGSANLIVDVNGYYNEQIEGMIAPSGAIYAGSNRLVSATVEAPGQYDVVTDTDVSHCTPTVDTYNDYVYGSAFAFNSDHITVFTWRLDSTTHLEVPENDYFYLAVSC